jgi:hypothetical protein
MGGEDPTQGSSSPLDSKTGSVGTASNDNLPEKGKQKQNRRRTFKKKIKVALFLFFLFSIY